MTTKKIILLTSLLLILFFISTTQYISAKNPGLSGPVELSNPLGTDDADKNISLIIGGVINVALGFVGSIALAIFIWGGFVWMTAAGNSNQVAKGKEILMWATIGLVVIFTSYAIVRFLFEALGVG